MSATTIESLEQRLTAVEEAVTRLRQRLEGKREGTHGLESLMGMFKDDPDFKQVIEYGRQIREGKMEVPGIDG